MLIWLGQMIIGCNTMDYKVFNRKKMEKCWYFCSITYISRKSFKPKKTSLSYSLFVLIFFSNSYLSALNIIYSFQFIKLSWKLDK